jgi:hypothetical protein
LPSLPVRIVLANAAEQLTNFAAARACRPSLLMMVTWVWITALLQFPVSYMDVRVVLPVSMEQTISQVY